MLLSDAHHQPQIIYLFQVQSIYNPILKVCEKMTSLISIAIVNNTNLVPFYADCRMLVACKEEKCNWTFPTINSDLCYTFYKMAKSSVDVIINPNYINNFLYVRSKKILDDVARLFSTPIKRIKINTWPLIDGSVTQCKKRNLKIFFNRDQTSIIFQYITKKY